MLEVGLGEINLHPWEMDEYTMEDFLIKVEGVRKKAIDAYQHTRALCFTMAKPYLKDKNMKMEKFWPLPGDVKEGARVASVKTMSPEDRKQRIKDIRQILIDRGEISEN